MGKLPASLKSTWRVVQVFKVIEGVNLGLGLFISTPYFYQIFQKIFRPKPRPFLYLSFIGGQLWVYCTV